MTKAKVYLLSFLLAFCSLSYEFIMVKVLSLTVGGRVFNYNLIVSIFTFSLGMGALYSERVRKEDTIITLSRLEFLISIVGLLGPVLLLIFQWRPLGVLFGFLIGFLTGFELPLLLKLKENKDSEILSFDYLGMFLASLLTPLILFRWVGLMPALFSIILTNFFLAFVIHSHRPNIKKSSMIPQWIFLVLVIGVNFYFHEPINAFFQKVFLWSVSYGH